MELKVEWKRVLNLRQYESETLTLGVTEFVRFPEEEVTIVQGQVTSGGVKHGKDLLALLVKAQETERQIFQHLAQVGDALVVERLEAAKQEERTPSFRDRASSPSEPARRSSGRPAGSGKW